MFNNPQKVSEYAQLLLEKRRRTTNKQKREREDKKLLAGMDKDFEEATTSARAVSYKKLNEQSELQTEEEQLLLSSMSPTISSPRVEVMPKASGAPVVKSIYYGKRNN